jgi:hypothetical protein
MAEGDEASASTSKGTPLSHDRTKPMNHETGQQPVDFDLTCWYINQRRVLELVGVDALYGAASGRRRVGPERTST